MCLAQFPFQYLPVKSWPQSGHLKDWVEVVVIEVPGMEGPPANLLLLAAFLTTISTPLTVPLDWSCRIGRSYCLRQAVRAENVEGFSDRLDFLCVRPFVRLHLVPQALDSLVKR